jgi:hypothetical protein
MKMTIKPKACNFFIRIIGFFVVALIIVNSIVHLPFLNILILIANLLVYLSLASILEDGLLLLVLSFFSCECCLLLVSPENSLDTIFLAGLSTQQYVASLTSFLLFTAVIYCLWPVVGSYLRRGNLLSSPTKSQPFYIPVIYFTLIAIVALFTSYSLIEGFFVGNSVKAFPLVDYLPLAVLLIHAKSANRRYKLVLLVAIAITISSLLAGSRVLPLSMALLIVQLSGILRNKRLTYVILLMPLLGYLFFISLLYFRFSVSEQASLPTFPDLANLYALDPVIFIPSIKYSSLGSSILSHSQFVHCYARSLDHSPFQVFWQNALSPFLPNLPFASIGELVQSDCISYGGSMPFTFITAFVIPVLAPLFGALLVVGIVCYSYKIYALFRVPSVYVMFVAVAYAPRWLLYNWFVLPRMLILFLAAYVILRLLFSAPQAFPQKPSLPG